MKFTYDLRVNYVFVNAYDLRVNYVFVNAYDLRVNYVFVNAYDLRVNYVFVDIRFTYIFYEVYIRFTSFFANFYS